MAVARRKVAAGASARSRPWTMPATSESPAPTVLAMRTFDGCACSARPAANQFTPCSPWDTTTCSTPVASSRRAAARCSSAACTGSPRTSPSSSVLGLTSQGAACRPARKASPLLSRATFRPWDLSISSSSRNHSGLIPRGRLPATTTASCPGATSARRCSKASRAASSTCGPGPLISVTWPSASTSLMLLRVSPGTRTKQSANPRQAISASNGARLSCPRKPPTVTL
ncbi:hypothetical protein WR25_01298 [Diploscapter pachys]|uniref:Uncharacterized protein n=1 Tax=Diploscapter pachys TaxID=2018661 RepID=A0A2A2K657_9BILA|nr:hypothetical protein WR25_01298 [Diploscapter pachys]